MHMQPLDWLIIALVFGALIYIGFRTKKVSNSVSDFLAANRCGRRYLLTMAEGMSTLGAISIVMYFEQYYEAGFVSLWWGQMLMPIGIFIALSGWVIYRFRETRAMTMAQFFEIRYSGRFRIFAGVVAWIAGIVNYGIFPAVSARLLIYLTDLPIYIYSLGPLELNLTLGAVMLVLLSIALLLTFSGGQVTIMVTDFLQGQFTNIVLLVLMVFVLWKFNWRDIVEGLGQTAPDSSMINPFVKETPEFGFWYFAILTFGAFYGYLAWQGGQGYNCSAKSPHEARMAKILSTFRSACFSLMIIILPLLVYAVMHNPQYAEQSEQIKTHIGKIPERQIQIQQTVPIGLAYLFPTGIIGLLVAVGVAAAVSTDNTYLHSWGSIFIQDVVLPFRKKHLPPAQHLKLLRWSILGVAIFGWCFSMLFPLREYIAMFFQITGAIYIGGAGAAIIGGLYWSRGTTAGAWGGMITGSVLATGSIMVSNILWPHILPGLQEAFPSWFWLQELSASRFPLNGAWLGFLSSLAAVMVYAVVSLLSHKAPFNMDKLLHRGRYAIVGEHVETVVKLPLWVRLVGMNKEFTRNDRIVYIITICWSALWFISFLLGTIYCLLVRPFSDETWVKWWIFACILYGVMGVIATFWFLWGGFSDLKHLASDLRTAARNELDDGMIHEPTETATAPLETALTADQNNPHKVE